MADKRFTHRFYKCLCVVNNLAATIKFYLIKHILNVAFRLLRAVGKHFNFTNGFK